MKTARLVRTTVAAALLTAASAAAAAGATLHVAPGGTGTGSSTAPFGSIQAALNAAQPGDIISVGAGTYAESLRSVRAGTSAAPIVLRAAGSRGSALVSAKGRVLTVSHEHIRVEGLVFDGNYGPDDVVRLTGTASGFVLRDSEVRRTSKDAIDMGAPSNVLIEDSLIHHALNAAGGRTDAHGVVAGAVRGLTIRRTEIHTFSGDAVQVDPGRAAPGWSDVVIDGCRLWLAPLPSSQNGFEAGTVPGENAVDTKAHSSLPRARLTIRNTEAWGFRNGLIGNMAAFNLKENIDATVDGVTVRDSEIAFRLRGPSSTHPAGARVRVQNAVVHDVATGFRYEDNIQNLRVWNVTLGSGVQRAFQAANAGASTLDVRNLLLLGSSLPPQAGDGSNLTVGASAFVDVKRHNYQLAAGSPAVDAGVAIAGVTADRQGTPRPQGAAYDIGAFERGGAGGGSAADVVLYAAKAPVTSGNWTAVADSTAAGGMRMVNEDLGAERLSKALAAPDSYFELTFHAEAGRPYRLWLRGRAERNLKTNDAVFVQFSGTINPKGRAIYRIGTTSATPVSLAGCGTCPLSGWSWQDNGYGDVLGPPIYFGASGPQTLRIQPREDGLSIDQIVLSSSAYLLTAPGSPIDDTTVLPEGDS